MGKILVTGATGYIGGRLVTELIARGYTVRIMVRTLATYLKNRWTANATNNYNQTIEPGQATGGARSRNNMLPLRYAKNAHRPKHAADAA